MQVVARCVDILRTACHVQRGEQGRSRGACLGWMPAFEPLSAKCFKVRSQSSVVLGATGFRFLFGVVAAVNQPFTNLALRLRYSGYSLDYHRTVAEWPLSAGHLYGWVCVLFRIRPYRLSFFLTGSVMCERQLCPTFVSAAAASPLSAAPSD